MISGRGLGAALLVLIAVTFSARAAERLFINSSAISLSHPVIVRAGDLFVPLREFGLWLGVETATGDNGLQVRSAIGEHNFPLDAFPRVNGVYYIRLTQLAALAGGQVHRIGDDVYVECTPVPLNSVESDPNRVTARFSAFVPYRVTEPESGRFVVTFYHTALATAPRQVTVTGGSVQGMEIAPGNDDTAVLTIVTTGGSVPAIKRFTAPGFYSVSLTFDHHAEVESQTVVSPTIAYHELDTNLGAGPVVIRYLYISNWAANYRLVPAVPATGVGTLADLADIARAHGAAAGINANFYDTATDDPVGLLIVDGVIMSSNYQRRAALGIDLFDRLTFFTPHVAIYLRTDTGKITVDDVNRPIGPNEIIAYTPGYAGPIRTGLTAGTFRVVTIRAGRVVAVETTPYIIPDRSATVVVACGTARDRLAALSIGDTATLGYTLDQGNLLITNAVSAGPLLISAGSDVLNPTAEGFTPGSYLVSGRAARSVLAVDQLGGLILLAVVKNSASVGANFHDLLTILHSLPFPIRDAIAFDGGHASSLVFRNGAAYREIAAGGKVAVGLLLIPTNQ